MDLTGSTGKEWDTDRQGKVWPPRKEGTKKVKKKGTWNRKIVVTTEPLEPLHCICQGSVQSSAFINLLWTWCFLISKTAGSFCEFRKKARVKQEGARRQLPINSLGLSYSSLTNAKWSPWAWDEDTCPGHSGSAPYPFDSAEQLSFLFRAPACTISGLWYPYCSYPPELLTSIPLPSSHLFTLLAHFLISSFCFVPQTWYLILFLGFKIWLYSFVTIYTSGCTAFGLNWANIFCSPAQLPRLPLMSMSWARIQAPWLPLFSMEIVLVITFVFSTSILPQNDLSNSVFTPSSPYLKITWDAFLKSNIWACYRLLFKSLRGHCNVWPTPRITGLNQSVNLISLTRNGPDIKSWNKRHKEKMEDFCKKDTRKRLSPSLASECHF